MTLQYLMIECFVGWNKNVKMKIVMKHNILMREKRPNVKSIKQKMKHQQGKQYHAKTSWTETSTKIETIN